MWTWESVCVTNACEYVRLSENFWVCGCVFLWTWQCECGHVFWESVHVWGGIWKYKMTLENVSVWGHEWACRLWKVYISVWMYVKVDEKKHVRVCWTGLLTSHWRPFKVSAYSGTPLSKATKRLFCLFPPPSGEHRELWGMQYGRLPSSTFTVSSGVQASTIDHLQVTLLSGVKGAWLAYMIILTGVHWALIIYKVCCLPATSSTTPH